ncbi:hypothetical protein Q3G72_019603 [Acer saccharum]|nr:hypothetical protein Q3G72_019603 [Acer saccharum]
MDNGKSSAGVSRGGSGDRFFDQSFRNHRSFSEVLKASSESSKGRFNTRVVKEQSVAWKKNHNAELGLSRCAIGVFKDFISISPVSSRLAKRDIPFSASYVGDKYVLWRFESEVDMVGFIKNRFFWDDCFTSMSRWFESWTPKRKLAWINTYGVPLSCCEEAFFRMLGDQFGVFLCLDDDKKAGERLDGGRFLALVSYEMNNWSNVSLSLKGKTFQVQLEIDPKPVSHSWLNSKLGLGDVPLPSSELVRFGIQIVS